MATRVTFRSRLERRALTFVLALLRRLPEGPAWSAGGALGEVWYLLDRRHRRLALRNIAAAPYPWSREPRRVARANFRHLGRVLTEFAHLPALSREELVARFSFEGLDHLERAEAGGRGVLLLTGHLGNWELMAAACVAGGRPLSVVAKAMENPLSDAVINGIRTAAGLTVIPHRGAALPVLRALRRGEAVGILLDQNALRREAVFVPFLGRPAATTYALAALVRRSGAPVLPVACWREGRNRHVIRIAPPLEIDLTDDPARDLLTNTARFTAALENMVSSRPDQWFWVHNRWKNQPLTEE